MGARKVVARKIEGVKIKGVQKLREVRVYDYIYTIIHLFFLFIFLWLKFYTYTLFTLSLRLYIHLKRCRLNRQPYCITHFRSPYLMRISATSGAQQLYVALNITAIGSYISGGLQYIDITVVENCKWHSVFIIAAQQINRSTVITNGR